MNIESFINTPLHNGLELFTFQRTALRSILNGLFVDDHQGEMLVAPTGHGKTIMLGRVIKYALQYIPSIRDHVGICKVLYLCPSGVVEQVRRSLNLHQGFNISPGGKSLDVWVMSISSLGHSEGEWFIETHKQDVYGDDCLVRYTWSDMMPPFIIVDECQSLMKGESIRTRIMKAANHKAEEERHKPAKRKFKFLYSSATPGARISEFECFTIASGISYQPYHWLAPAPLTHKQWHSFIAPICSDPSEHNVEAVKRYMKLMDGHITKVPYQNCGDVWSINVIDFQHEEDHKAYNLAYEEYLDALAKADKELQGIEIFHIIRVFCMKAELLRAPVMAQCMYEAWKHHGKAPSCAVMFKQSLVAVVECLVHKYKIPKSLIATVWGGLPKDQATILEDELDRMDEEMDEDDDDIQEYHGWNLSPQSKKQRQVEIDAFQSGKKEFFVHTFAAGGVGIDLPRDKESLRPREKYLGVIYNDKQFVQANREARINSIGDTNLIILLFRNTIETERVFPKLLKKLKCLHEVMGAKSSFASVLIPSNKELNNVRKKLEYNENNIEEALLEHNETKISSSNEPQDISQTECGSGGQEENLRELPARTDESNNLQPKGDIIYDPTSSEGDAPTSLNDIVNTPIIGDNRQEECNIPTNPTGVTSYSGEVESNTSIHKGNYKGEQLTLGI